MLKFIRYSLLTVICCVFLSGCTTDKLMKKEDFSIEKEKEAATPLEAAKPLESFAQSKGGQAESIERQDHNP